jgi:hypothetical protein
MAAFERIGAVGQPSLIGQILTVPVTFKFCPDRFYFPAIHNKKTSRILNEARDPHKFNRSEL